MVDVHADLSALNISSAANGLASRQHAATNGSIKPTGARLALQRNQDITRSFSHASKALHHGELIKDDFFTLFEAVGALEIMDHKMDSGHSIPDQDAAMEEFDPYDFGSAEEIIWIMDQLLCFEMAWHDGYPLSQTLLTSLHLNNLLSCDNVPLNKLQFHSWRNPSADQSNSSVSNVLRAYCLAVAKCCDNVIQEVVSEHFYEEEDFITANFTKDLLSRIDEADIMDLLNNATVTLDRDDTDPNLKSALLARLQHRGSMLRAFRPIQTNSHSEKADLFEKLLEETAALSRFHALGKATGTSVFTERTQRFLASNTPPRPMKSIPWDEAIRKLEAICKDTMATFAVSRLGPDFSPSSLMRVTWEFTSRKPQPLSYPRAIMQGILFKSGAVLSSYPHIDLILNDIQSLVLPASPLLDRANWEAELPSSQRYQIARRVDDFVARSMEEYLNLYRMALQNRCRIRRTFAQSIQILDSLQAMAEEADLNIKALCNSSLTTRDPVMTHDDDFFYPLAAWVYHHKLAAMEVVVQMGFELEVYLPDELAECYALLHYFSQIRIGHYSTISSTLRTRATLLPPSSTLAKQEILASLTHLTLLTSQVTLKSQLASALSELYGLLVLLGLIHVPARQFSTPQLRHELRLKPFLPIGTPSLPAAEDMVALLTPQDSKERIGALTDGIDSKVKSAKTEVARMKETLKAMSLKPIEQESWARELKEMMFVAVQTGVACAAIQRHTQELGVRTVGDVFRVESIKNESRETATARETRRKEIKQKINVDIPTPDARINPWWIVPKITMRTT